MKKLLVGLLVVVMLFGLTACAKDQSESGDAGTGKLVLYTSSGEEITDPILKAFGNKYPDIKVEIVKAGSGELLARIKAEAENPSGDILLGGDPVTFEANSDLFEAYVSATDKEMVTSSENGLWHPWSITLTPIAVNKDRLPDESMWPTTLKDLYDSKYAGDKIAFCDPGQSGTGASIANNMATLYGWDEFSTFLDNCEVMSGSDPMFDAVKDGTYPIGFVNEDLGLKWLDAKINIELIYPTDGVVNSVDCLSIIKGGKGTENAKLFIDFFGSTEVHEIIVNDVMKRSTRKDAVLSDDMVDINSLTLITAERINRDAVTEKYNDAYEKSRAN